METCANGHDEVCFEVKGCPVCAMESERDDALAELASLKREVDRLEQALDAASSDKAEA